VPVLGLSAIWCSASCICFRCLAADKNYISYKHAIPADRPLFADAA
jgi:hypothetical protein